MSIDTTFRTDTAELMDDFAMEGDLLKEALDKIAKINQLLGGNQLTLSGIQTLLSKVGLEDTITIVDLGCGNGDMLRTIADSEVFRKYSLQLIGIDANAYTIAYAKELSHGYPNISYRCEDIFEPEFKKMPFDMVLCTLTLHHFKETEILSLLEQLYTRARIGIVINDLQRSGVAYRLFQALSVVFQLNSMSTQDGLTSILRGFKKNELEVFSKKLNFNHYTIQWKWAFRYQWIISKL